MHQIAFLEMVFYNPYLVIATAISYTGNLLSRNRYFPISVKADAESIASLPTLLRSKYGVASRPWKKKWRNNYVVIKSSMTKLSWFHEKKGIWYLPLKWWYPRWIFWRLDLWVICIANQFHSRMISRIFWWLRYLYHEVWKKEHKNAIKI